MGSVPQFVKTYSYITKRGRKTFFLQKVFLFAIFPRKIANSLFKNAPCGIRVPLSAESGLGASRPLSPSPPFIKGRRVPVAHKQGADRSGSEDLDENFYVAG